MGANTLIGGNQARVDEFQRAGQKAGIKVTQQRLKIYREAAISVEHPDAETYFGAFSSESPLCRSTPSLALSG